MTQIEIQAPTRIAPNGYRVDVSRGQRIGRVSSEWFNRPDDERYLSLTDLHNSVKRRSARSKTRIIESEAIRVEASTGGGMVSVKMDGQKKVLEVKIDPDAAEDVEMLQDMIRGAVNEAGKRVDEQAQQKMGGMLGGLGLPPGLL